jgi:site-specific DNA-cytosine methylase
MAHGAEPATVSSFHELYRWVDHTIGFVANATGQGPVPLRGQMAERSKGFTMSTAFSGIGAPENALHAIMCHLGCECSRPLYNIEWDLECRRELCALPHPPMCLFDDINQFWNETIDMGSISSVSQYEKLIKSGIGILPHGWCLLQLRTCKLQTAECHIGGTPCPDWSAQGSRNKEAGPDAMATMAWIGQRYTLEEPIWINENVAAFDWFLMCNILSESISW